jgi:hypothetical protein
LYALYTADFPQNPDWNATTSLYADDTALLCKSWSVQGAVKRLQSTLNAALEGCAKWRTVIKPRKTQVVLFRGRKKPAAAPESHLKEIIIPWSTSASYLGIQLDEKLKYHRHMQILHNKLKAAYSNLRPSCIQRTSELLID